MENLLKEGDTDPSLGKVIKFLILQTDNFIVYIDTNLEIQWWYSEGVQLNEEFGQTLNRVAFLESRARFIENTDHLQSVKRLIAEGLARHLEYSSIKLSNEILDLVEKQICELNLKTSWDWYFKSAYWITSICIFSWALLWVERSTFAPFIGHNGFEIILGGLIGAGGALISVISRGNQLNLDANAGKSIHQTEGAARIIVGIAGASLAALALKGGLLLSGVVFSGSQLAVLLTLSIVAGASERLVPSLVSKVEDITLAS